MIRRITGITGVALFGIASMTTLLVAPYMASAGGFIPNLFGLYYVGLGVLFGSVTVAQFLPMMIDRRTFLENAFVSLRID